MDATNAGTPQAGGQLSGEVARQYAIKRLKSLQEVGLGKTAGQPPSQMIGPPGQKG
jgi:hypothetical protein